MKKTLSAILPVADRQTETQNDRENRTKLMTSCLLVVNILKLALLRSFRFLLPSTEVETTENMHADVVSKLRMVQCVEDVH